MGRLHLQAYAEVQLLVAMRSHRNEYFSGQHVGHSPSLDERIRHWTRSGGSANFEKCRKHFIVGDGEKAKQQKLDVIAKKARKIVQDIMNAERPH
ncbi:hypothetical protein KW782_03450 [Candidatus Parcubacteria bacterium]|nr:hypothetical protein [Candidatus Parcubacteria bacterium]